MREIGERLRSAREAKGITLEAAEEQTKIRRKYIAAIEAGLRADLPGDVYLKGFIRTYGNYLGLDGAALVESFKRLSRGPNNLPQNAVAQSATADLAPPTAAEKPLRSRSSRRRESPEVPSGPPPVRGAGVLFLLLLVLAGIGYLGWLIALQFSPTAAPAVSTPPPAIDSTPPPPTAGPAPTLPGAPKVQMAWGAGEDVLFSVPDETVDLKMEFAGKEALWIRVIIDEKWAYEGFPTETLTFQGKKVQVRMGHMRGVSLVVNGQRFEHPLDGGPFTLYFMSRTGS